MKLILYISLILLAFSCKKSEDRTCWKSHGEIETLTVKLPSFDTLYVYKNIEYELIESTENKVEIIAGKNLVKHIKTEVSHNSLTIKNLNKCAFLRSYKKKVKVRIYTPTLSFIYSEASEDFRSVGALTFPVLKMQIHDGSAKTVLEVNNHSLTVSVTHGWADFEVSGTTNRATLECQTNSFAEARNLKVNEYLYTYSRSVGDMYVNANVTEFKAVLTGKGNVYYKGTFDTSDFTLEGTGEVIAL